MDFLPAGVAEEHQLTVTFAINYCSGCTNKSQNINFINFTQLGFELYDYPPVYDHPPEAEHSAKGPGH